MAIRITHQTLESKSLGYGPFCKNFDSLDEICVTSELPYKHLIVNIVNSLPRNFEGKVTIHEREEQGEIVIWIEVGDPVGFDDISLFKN